MTGLTWILLAAAIAFALSEWRKIPLIPLLLLAGLALSFTHAAPDSAGILQVLELGLTFLAFSMGLELDPGRFKGQRKAVTIVGLAQMFFVILGVYPVSRWLGFNAVESLYLAVGFSTSSTLVVIRHLRLRLRSYEPFGRLVVGVLLLQDILMILLVSAISHLDDGAMAMLKEMAIAALLGALALGTQRRIIPALLRRIRPDEELLLLGMLAVLFGFTGIADAAGLPAVAGSFFAGLAFSAFPVNGVVRSVMAPLSSFFLALFFVSLGAVVTLPTGALLAKALLLSMVILCVTPPVVAFLSEQFGLNARASIEGGLLLAQTSELSLVLALGGLFHQHLSEDLFSVMALVAILTMSLTPFLATDRNAARLLRIHPSRRRTVTGGYRNHVLMLGFGTSGMWAARPLLNQGETVVVVEDDPAVIHELRKTSMDSLRGDGGDERMLERAGARHAKLILTAMRRVEDAERVLRSVPEVPTVVRVFEKSDAERIQALGGIPVLNSVAARETFMQWFERSGLANKEQEQKQASSEPS